IVVGVEYALAWSALIAGALYLALAWTLWRTGRETFRLLVEAFAALGVIFASLAIPLAFDAKVTAAMWSVEGAGLVWLGLRQERKLARAFGILLQVFAGIGFIGAFPALRPDRFLLNTAYLGTVMLGVSALASSFWLHRDRKKLAEYETAFPLVLALWGTAWWLCGGIYQIEHFWSAALLGGALVFVAAT